MKVFRQLDDCTRECVALIADTSISGVRVARELDRLLAEHGKPRSIVSYNGTELTSNAILRWADDRKIGWHYIAPGKPMQNAFSNRSSAACATNCSTRFCSARCRTARRARGMARRLQYQQVAFAAWMDEPTNLRHLRRSAGRKPGRPGARAGLKRQSRLKKMRPPPEVFNSAAGAAPGRPRRRTRPPRCGGDGSRAPPRLHPALDGADRLVPARCCGRVAVVLPRLGLRLAFAHTFLVRLALALSIVLVFGLAIRTV
jgi:hypothetical protein